jgi:hypothetical protein
MGWGKEIKALTITSPSGEAKALRLASSHFGFGILTFHLGWLFRTSPGWGIWARGLPNRYKEGNYATRRAGGNRLAPFLLHDELALRSAGNRDLQGRRALLLPDPLPPCRT